VLLFEADNDELLLELLLLLVVALALEDDAVPVPEAVLEVLAALVDVEVAGAV
jgi:hypothetical protein